MITEWNRLRNHILNDPPHTPNPYRGDPAHMQIEKIIYDTTRNLHGVDDKLRIATIFLFCYRLDSKSFAELLYAPDTERFIDDLSEKYKQFEVDFNIRLKDKNVRDCFYMTRSKVILKYDSDGYYKALYVGDPFALAIDELVNYDFDAMAFRRFAKNMSKQLELGFNER